MALFTFFLISVILLTSGDDVGFKAKILPFHTLPLRSGGLLWFHVGYPCYHFTFLLRDLLVMGD